MKRTRESKDRENAAGTYGMFCLHSTRIVSFLGRAGGVTEKTTRLSAALRDF